MYCFGPPGNIVGRIDIAARIALSLVSSAHVCVTKYPSAAIAYQIAGPTSRFLNEE